MEDLAVVEGCETVADYRRTYEQETPERMMATYREIEEIKDIPGADRIQAFRVGGWWVVGRKGEFQLGDTVIYFEIDSWIPSTVAPFLTREGHYPKVYNTVEGERLRTIKLRGQLSQGLLLPTTILEGQQVPEDQLDDFLCIQKWERPMSPQLAGLARGDFPYFIRKTDEERIQNLKPDQYVGLFEVTEKMDGSSMSVYLREDEFGVCSRNINLKETEDNTFWKTARAYDLERILRELKVKYGFDLAFQGELCGPGIQGNIYELTEFKYYIYNIWDITNQTKLDARQRDEIVSLYGEILNHVPVIFPEFEIGNWLDRQFILNMADGQSYVNPKTKREGLVYKDMNDPNHSFKAISNQFLLKNDS